MLMYRVFKLAASMGLAIPLALAADVYQVEAKRLADLMNWKPGDVIAEIGAGEGQMSFFAAALVGAKGHVYTTELDDSKIARLKEKLRTDKLQNVTVIKAAPVNTNLPDACCQAIFMRRVYHHFVNPALTDAALFRDLKPGGMIGIIDFPPRSSHGIAMDLITRELKAVGFQIVSESNGWPEQDYCVIARKPAQFSQYEPKDAEKTRASVESIRN